MVYEEGQVWYGFTPIGQELMMAVSHLSNAQELAREDAELAERLNQAKFIIIEEIQKLGQGTPEDKQ